MIKLDVNNQSVNTMKLQRRSAANKSNRDKKTLYHHTGARAFIYNAKELKDKGEHLYFIKSYSQAYDSAHNLKAAENEVSDLLPAFALLPAKLLIPTFALLPAFASHNRIEYY